MGRKTLKGVVEQRTDALGMREGDKRVAVEYVCSGERLGEVVCQAGSSLRSALELVHNAIAHRAE